MGQVQDTLFWLHIMSHLGCGIQEIPLWLEAYRKGACAKLGWVESQWSDLRSSHLLG